MLKKRKIIYALISFSLLLIFGNIILEKYYYDDTVIVQEISRNEIEEKFGKLEHFKELNKYIGGYFMRGKV